LKDAVGRPLAEVFHIVNARTREPVENPVAKVLATGQIMGLANGTTLIARDGAEYLIADSAAPIQNDAGKAIGVVMVFRDVTAEHAAAEALRQSEERFSLAFRTSPYAITITRMEDGKFVEVNDAFASITGFSREEAIADTSVGLNLWVNPEDRKRVVSELLEQGVVNGWELPFRRRNGEILTGLFSAQILYLNGERCILSSINDITERKQAENGPSKVGSRTFAGR
jgi:PAS domain S-box-containing protein